MRRLVVVALLGTLLAVPTLTSADSSCPRWKEELGVCTTNTGTDVVIDGTQETENDPGDTSDDDVRYPPGDEGTPEKPFDFQQCLDDWDSYIHCFRGSEDEEQEDEDENDTEVPVITMTDVARFAPAGSVVTGEPDNVGVVGLPTNFVATASVHTVDADLFGFPVSVRFTPSAYDFSFGDGATATTTSGGAAWTALDQAQFTPTPTSHTYRERGSYEARVDVRYTAEVDFGVGWFPITGEVTAGGAAQEVRIFEAHTALVAHTCQQAPASPGC